MSSNRQYNDVGIHQVTDKNDIICLIVFGPLGRRKLCYTVEEALVFLSNEFNALHREEEAFQTLMSIRFIRNKGYILTEQQRLPGQIIGLYGSSDQKTQYIGFDEDNMAVGVSEDSDMIVSLLQKALEEKMKS